MKPRLYWLHSVRITAVILYSEPMLMEAIVYKISTLPALLPGQTACRNPQMQQLLKNPSQPPENKLTDPPFDPELSAVGIGLYSHIRDRLDNITAIGVPSFPQLPKCQLSANFTSNACYSTGKDCRPQWRNSQKRSRLCRPTRITSRSNFSRQRLRWWGYPANLFRSRKR